MSDGFNVAILSGGESRRFGRSKATMRVDEEGLLARTVRMAQRVGRKVVIVGELVPDEVSTTSGGVMRCADLDPGGGPLQAMVGAWEWLGGGNLLILGVDLPRLTPGHLRALARFEGEEEARLSMNRGRETYVPAMYRESAMASFRRAYREGVRALYPVVEGLRVTRLTEEQLRAEGLDVRGLEDFDTPEEWEDLMGPVR